MASWKLIGIVIAVILCVTVIVAYFSTLSLRRRREKNRISTACAAAATDTIFAIMISCRNAYATAKTLVSIFERAHCPLRVYVGVFELYDPTASMSVIEEYELQCKFSAFPFCLKDHVRIIRMPSQENPGILAAHEQVDRHLFRGEKYVASIQPGSELAPAWDAYCIDCVTLAGKRHSTDKIVLTSLHSGEQAATTLPGSYCGLHDDGALLPYRIKHVKAAQFVAAMAWSSVFSFSSSRRLKDVPYERFPDADPDGLDAVLHDMYMTILFIRGGWRILHPTGAVVAGAASQTSGRGSQKWREDMQTVNRKRATPAAFQHLGITISGAAIHLSARSRLGLTVNAADDEIIAKLGSMGEYLSILSRLELKK